ncbi:MAG: FRG domain-containing protein [Clostridium sp.]|nr:FRG domain-containing protein [Clostridium sp.]
MFSARDILKQRLDDLSFKLNESLDFDFSAVSKKINTIEEFNSEILSDFYSGKQLFYRGERVNAPDRNLLPTMLRKPAELFKNNDLGIIHLDAQFIYDYYSSLGNFVDVFHKTMGKADAKHLYDICAFAQHYYHVSPLIDFTKSVYPALSFALKDRKAFDKDIILYVVELKKQEDYTNDISTANEWLKDLSVYVSCFEERDVKSIVKDIIESKSLHMNDDFRLHMEKINAKPNPKAKLIDVPTNTRMKFQQGVFLMLTDFQLFNVKYFTKNIREDFYITKYIINKEICPQLLQLIEDEAPWYNYKYLTDVEAAFKIAVND